MTSVLPDAWLTTLSAEPSVVRCRFASRPQGRAHDTNTFGPYSISEPLHYFGAARRIPADPELLNR
jgi:hypothetical protein